MDRLASIEKDGKPAYEVVADAAVSIMRSEYASMQRLESGHGTSGELVLLSFRGFMVGTKDLVTYRQTGIRAVQTTPLVSDETV